MEEKLNVFINPEVLQIPLFRNFMVVPLGMVN